MCKIQDCCREQERKHRWDDKTREGVFWGPMVCWPEPQGYLCCLIPFQGWYNSGTDPHSTQREITNF